MIEVMIVVAIIGILSSLAAPSFNLAMRHRTLDQTAHALGSAIYKARSFAITTNQSIQVDTNGSVFSVHPRQNGTVMYRYPSDPSTFIDSTILIQQSDWLLFNAVGSLIDGNLSPAGQVTVTVTDTLTSEQIIMNVVNSGATQYTRVN